MTQTQTFH